MKYEIEDAGLLENCYLSEGDIEVYSYYGYTYFEIYNGAGEHLSINNKEQFLELYEKINFLKERLDKLND